MTDVFISYSRKDKEFVQVLHQALIKSKYDAWVDWEDIPLTADWWEEIKAGIEAADTFIFVISPDSICSKVCSQEIDHAVANNKRLVPIVRRDGFDGALTHPSLKKPHWLYFREEDDFEETFQALVKAINTDLDYIHRHTRLLVKALEWNSKQRELDLLLRGSQLEEAITWITESGDKEPRLTQVQREYVDASRKAERNRQEAEIQRQQKDLHRQRIWLGLVGAAFVVASGLGVLAFSQFRVAEARRREVEHSQIETLATSAEAFLNSNQGLDGLLYGLQAARKLEQMEDVPLRTKFRVIAALQQGLYRTPERNRLVGHSDQVWYATLSPDGQFIASSSRDHTAKLWTLDGQELATLEGHSNSIGWVAISLDNQLIATASEDGTIKLWRQDGELLKTLTEHTAPVRSVNFTPDGKQLVSASRDGTVKFWDLEGNVLKTLQAHAKACNASFSPNGDLFLTFSCGSEAKLWSPSGELQTTFSKHTGKITRGVFSPDSQRIATSTMDGVIKLWTIEGQELKTMQAHTQGIWGLNFSADGQVLYSAGEDGNFKFWSADGELIDSLAELTPAIASIDVSANGEMLVLGDRGGVVRIWKLNRQLFKHDSSISDVEFSPDGQTLVTADFDESIKIWTVEGTLLKKLRGFDDLVGFVDFNQDATQIRIGTSNGIIQSLTLEEQELANWTAPSSLNQYVTFSADGKLAARGGRDGLIEIYRANGEKLSAFKAHEEAIEVLAFSPDGKTIASAGKDDFIKLWTLTGKLLQTLTGHRSGTKDLAFSSNAKFIVSSGRDRNIKLWTTKGEEVKILKGHQGAVNSVSFSPDGNFIASGSDDETIKLWTIDGHNIATFRGTKSVISELDFSPDGNQLFVGSEDATAMLWSLDFEDLLIQTCHELRNYLTIGIDLTEEQRELCSDVKRDWIAEAEDLAKQGKVTEAIPLFQEALKADPELEFDPLLKAQQIAAARPLELAEQQIAQHDLEGATQAFARALELYPPLNFDPALKARQELAHHLVQTSYELMKSFVGQKDVPKAMEFLAESERLDPEVNIPTILRNSICWYGSLYGYAADVLDACEKAVNLAPKDGDIQDSRGLARALTGDIEGAVEDFQAFVNWTRNDEQKARRQRWIEALRAGEDPFTPEELESLR